MAFCAFERLLTIEHAAAVAVGVTEEVEVAIQLQALDIRNEGAPICGIQPSDILT